MAYPLIIFGAGASRDYSELGTIAPLTNDLVEPGFLKEELMKKYPGSGDLLAELILQVRRKKRGFEEALTEHRERAAKSHYAQTQFVALEFYLRDLFSGISESGERAHETNNYKIIASRIHEYSGGRACVVTFNYDSLFERNVRGFPITKIDDYVTGNLKVVKLHGSHNWMYINNRSLVNYARSGIERGNDFGFYQKHPNYLTELKGKGAEPYHKHEIAELEKPASAPEYAKFPALAIPVNGKKSYVCPELHISELIKSLREVDRILIVGWKAGDPFLLDLLAKNLPQNGLPILVVSRELETAKQIGESIGERLPVELRRDIIWRGGGFSGFTSESISHDFFSR